MRIQQLNLKAFGPFTNLAIDFGSPATGLQMIHGPNEAGKSSALRAIRALLFGLKQKGSRSDEDLKFASFLHPQAQVRVGGILTDSEGKQVGFVRRHAKPHLRDLNDDKQVPDEVLDSLLTGLDFNTFNRMFGLSHETLREGSETLLVDNGSLGQALASAGGMKILKETLVSLEKQSEQIFKISTGRSGELKTMATKVSALQSRLEGVRLKSSEWETISKTLSEFEKQKLQLENDIQEHSVQLQRLERLRNARASFTRWTSANQKLLELQNIKDIRHDFESEFREFQNDNLVAKKALESEQESIEKRKLEKSSIEVWEEIILEESAIDSLSERIATLRGSASTSAADQLALNNLDEDLRILAEQIGVSVSETDLEKYKVPEAQKSRIKALIRSGESLQQLFDQNHESSRIAEDECRQLKTELDELGPAAVTTLLQTEIERSVILEKYEAEITDLKSTLDQERNQLNELKVSLVGWQGELASLLDIKLPLLTTIEDYEERLRDLTGAVSSRKKELESSKFQLEKINRELQQLDEHHAVPSVSELTEHRSARDKQVQDLQKLSESPSLFKAAEVHTALFSVMAAIQKADQYVDLLRADADRVAQRDQLQQTSKEHEANLKQLQKHLAETETELQELNSAWVSEWADVPVKVRSPREMKSWHAIAQKAISQSGIVQNVEKTISELTENHNSGRQSVLRLLRDEVHPNGDSGDDIEADPKQDLESLSLKQLFQVARDRMSHLQNKNERIRQFETQLTTAQKQAAEAKTKFEISKENLDSWTSDWAEAMLELGMSKNSLREQADKSLELLTKRDEKLQKRREIQQRIQSHSEIEETIQSDLQRLETRLERPRGQQTIEDSIRNLRKELKIHQERAALHNQLETQLLEHFKKRDDLQNRLETSDAHLESLLKESGCQNLSDIPDFLLRSAARQEVLKEMIRSQTELEELSNKPSFSEFVDELRKLDQDQLPVQIETSQSILKSLSEQKDSLIARTTRVQTEFEKMNGNDEAAEIANQIEFLLTQMQEKAEELLVLSISQSLVKATLDEYQSKSQGPVIARASEIFARLTRNSFSGVKTDYGPKDEPVLVAVRASETREELHTDSLSEGTRDQLYLALRIATVEYWIHKNQPVPFVVDDILLTFDDQRATAALEVLAELADKTQVIFFTHHQHMIDLAHHNLDNAKFRVHRIGAV